MPKSALKKIKETTVNNDKRVTFCKTIKIFGNSAVPESSAEKSEDDIQEFFCADVSGILSGSQFIISHKKTRDFDENKLAEDADDFFVHKVVYDDDETQHENTDNKQETRNETSKVDLVSYPSECDRDFTDFVVHKVILPENEIADECSDSETKLGTNEKEEQTTKPDEQSVRKGVFELSIKNIEQHNKLTESKILANCDVESKPKVPPMVISEITLSPPLKELNVKQLMCPESDNWFWNLDISPLNSVQETDSESNLSSEDTMIMMTSEECEKNEQRIQESLQKFQSMKQQKTKENEPINLKFVDQKLNTNCEDSNVSVMSVLEPTDINQDFTCSEPQAFVENITSLLSQLHVATASIEDTAFYDPVYDTTETYKNNISLFPLKANNLSKKTCDDSVLLKFKKFEDLTSCRDSLRSLDSNLSSVEIPQDVREWKIALDKSLKSKEDNKNSQAVYEPQNTNSTPVEVCNNPDICDESTMLTSNSKNDELEHFVDQCTDRVERIKKRYSVSEKLKWTPRRGIRPRFGSTAEILHQFQRDSSPMISNPHYVSWPCYNSCVEQNNSDDRSTCLNIPSALPLNTFHPTSCISEQSNNIPSCSVTDLDDQRKCVLSGHVISRSAALLTFHERGVPEGASPPRLSTESLNECEDTQNSLSGIMNDSVVYYSMKV